MADAVAARHEERERLLSLARNYVEDLGARISITAAAVVGSVARGDFNVWSDIDVVIVADGLPDRVPERSALLAADAPAGVQPIGFSREEFRKAWARGNPLAREAGDHGVTLLGNEFFAEFRAV